MGKRLSDDHMDRATILECCKLITDALEGQQHFAFVGGVACIVAGSPRPTRDFNIIVPKGCKRKTARLLEKYDWFYIRRDPNSWNKNIFSGFYLDIYGWVVNVNIITPHDLARNITFDEESTVHRSERNIPILPLQDLLAMKIVSANADDRKKEKKVSDGTDIKFLRDKLSERGIDVDVDWEVAKGLIDEESGRFKSLI